MWFAISILFFFSTMLVSCGPAIEWVDETFGTDKGIRLHDFQFDPYLFDEESGRCLNSEGEEGQNSMLVGPCGEILEGNGINFEGASLPGIDLRGAIIGVSLEGTDLRNAVLRKARFRPGVNLTDANLDGADLREADLRGALLRGTSAVGADFSQATLSNARIDGGNFRGAVFTRARFCGAQLLYPGAGPLQVAGPNLKRRFHQVRVDHPEIFEFLEGELELEGCGPKGEPVKPPGHGVEPCSTIGVFCNR